MNHAEAAYLDHAHDVIEQHAMQQLARERRNRVLDALYVAGQCGVPDRDLRVLCDELGVSWRDLQRYAPAPVHRDDPDHPLPF